MSDETVAETLKNGWVAGFHYKIFDVDGNLLDSSEGHPPANTLMGSGTTLLGIEEALEGRKAGDNFEVELSPAKAFGVKSDSPPQAIPKVHFDVEGEILVGMQCMAETEDGRPMPVWVHKIEDTQVWITENHPLAGVSLKVELEVVEAREATVDELTHGHVHSESCNHD